MFVVSRARVLTEWAAAVPRMITRYPGAGAACAPAVDGRGMATFKKKLMKRSAAKPHSSLLEAVGAPREWEKEYKSLARGKRPPQSTFASLFCHSIEPIA